MEMEMTFRPDSAKTGKEVGAPKARQTAPPAAVPNDLVGVVAVCLGKGKAHAYTAAEAAAAANTAHSLPTCMRRTARLRPTRTRARARGAIGSISEVGSCGSIAVAQEQEGERGCCNGDCLGEVCRPQPPERRGDGGQGEVVGETRRGREGRATEGASERARKGARAR